MIEEVLHSVNDGRLYASAVDYIRHFDDSLIEWDRYLRWLFNDSV